MEKQFFSTGANQGLNALTAMKSWRFSCPMMGTHSGTGKRTDVLIESFCGFLAHFCLFMIVITITTILLPLLIGQIV